MSHVFGVWAMVSGLVGGRSTQVYGVWATVSGELLSLWCLGNGMDSALWSGLWTARVEGVGSMVTGLVGRLSSQVCGVWATVSGELLGLWCLSYGVDSALWSGLWTAQV